LLFSSNVQNVFATGRTINGSNLNDMWHITILKYDGRGVEQWVRTYDDPYGTTDFCRSEHMVRAVQGLEQKEIKLVKR
jgi:hypothetical protein